MYFDDTFTGGEDIDLCLRLRERAPLVSVPEAIIYHNCWKPDSEVYPPNLPFFIYKLYIYST